MEGNFEMDYNWYLVTVHSSYWFKLQFKIICFANFSHGKILHKIGAHNISPPKNSVLHNKPDGPILFWLEII